MNELVRLVLLTLQEHWIFAWLLMVVLILSLYCFFCRLMVLLGRRKNLDQYQKSSLANLLKYLETPAVLDFKITIAPSWSKRVYGLAGLGLSYKNFCLGIWFLLVVILLTSLLAKQFFWGCVFSFTFFALSWMGIFMKAREQRAKLVSQIPMFLQSLGNAMQAGYTIEQALGFIAEEMNEPLRSEVLVIYHKLKLKIPLESALEEFADVLQNPEVDFFVESTLIQIKTGGNLVILFQKIAYLIEEKLKLNRDIKSFTSQGKLSGILIAGLWPVSLLTFSWLSPQHTDVLFSTLQGQTMLGISVLLELIGFWFIWKIITIKI